MKYESSAWRWDDYTLRDTYRDACEFGIWSDVALCIQIAMRRGIVL